MSFMKTLVTLAVGFAAAKGVDKFNKAGGMANMQDQLKKAGDAGGLADRMGQMAEKMGIPGAADTSRKIAGSFGENASVAAASGQKGLTNLMGAFAGMAASGTAAVQDMMEKVPGGTAMNAMTEDNAKLMIRAMIMGAKADGVIDADERARIMSHLGDAAPEEVAFVEAEMAAPIDLDGLVAATSDTMRAQVYAAAAMAMREDHPAESDFLAQLATMLGLDDATRNQVHDNLSS